jgi:carbamoyltransferase
MKILGISCFYHDSAAALLEDGVVIGAAQEERFSRIKGDPSVPIQSINFLLSSAGLEMKDIDVIVYYENPIKKFNRILHSHLLNAPQGFEQFQDVIDSQFIDRKFFVKSTLKKLLQFDGKIEFIKHHESHAASSFFPSPFESAAFLTVDGVGELETTTYGSGIGNELHFKQSINYPHSLGLLYASITNFLGFKINSGEYKVMGLAPYGEPKYMDLILSQLIDLKEDGSYALNMDYFSYEYSNRMTKNSLGDLFKRKPRERESEITQSDMDLARSIQEVTDMVMLKIAKHVAKVTDEKNLCLAGGVALNCVANGKIKRENIFKNIWIQPASGDSGAALGAALYYWYQILGNERLPNKYWRQKNTYLGPSYSDPEIKEFLDDNQIPYIHNQNSSKFIANLIASGNVVAMFSGKMEFGPRALGSRSILGDPRNPNMQKIMNLKIKFRESFRPFAPVIIGNKAKEWFELEGESPFMLLVVPVKIDKRIHTDTVSKGFGIEKLNEVRSLIPAVTHIDYSARVQTVEAESNFRLHQILLEFEKITGCPILINTSFNIRGEPIVCTLEDAYSCFMGTEIDYLVLGEFILSKESQPKDKINNSLLEKYELD